MNARSGAAAMADPQALPAVAAAAKTADADPQTGVDSDAADRDRVFASAAELFGLLATPIRLKIISALCGHEKNVSQLLAEIDTTQPNMSQHLATLYRAGVVTRRRHATQIYYRIGSEPAAALCRAVCTQIATGIVDGHPMTRALATAPLDPRRSP